MTYFILYIINVIISEFISGLINYDESNDKWYSAGIFFKWPKELGRFLYEKLFS